jgi:hypothetical protein
MLPQLVSLLGWGEGIVRTSKRLIRYTWGLRRNRCVHWGRLEPEKRELVLSLQDLYELLDDRWIQVVLLGALHTRVIHSNVLWDVVKTQSWLKQRILLWGLCLQKGSLMLLRSRSSHHVSERRLFCQGPRRHGYVIKHDLQTWEGACAGGGMRNR